MPIMLQWSLVTLSLLMGSLFGWFLVRRDRRTPINPRPWLAAAVTILVLAQLLAVVTPLGRLGMVLPLGDGATVQISLHATFNGVLVAASCGTCWAFLIMTRHRLRWRAVTCGAALLGLQLYLSVPRGGIAGRLENRRSPDGVILQSSGYSCAAAVCANVLEHYGHPTTEKEMAAKLGLTESGSSPAQVAYLLRSFGLQADRFRSTPPDIARLKPPAILWVFHPDTGPETHLVIFMGSRRGVLEIWDPLVGKTYSTEKELLAVWQGLIIQMSR